MIKSIIKKGEYFDSVSLMIVGKRISEEYGISDAAVVMGTNENKEILKMSDLYIPDFDSCSDTDLIIVLKHDDEKKLSEVFPKVEEMLKEIRNKSSENKNYTPKSLESALKYEPDANLVLISIAGKYAGEVAKEALDNNLHVMMFSDNVPLETEILLKKLAVSKNLLMMGPDCGTAIINGVPLAFANVVNRGDIGIISASGTGLQEVSSIISDAGFGISQAIGTGGRDLKENVGGLMFLSAIKALKDDENTNLIVLISKPPHPLVLQKIKTEIEDIKKPIVAVFLGFDKQNLKDFNLTGANTLEEAALRAISIAGKKSYEIIKEAFMEDYTPINTLAEKLYTKIGKNRKYIRGLYSGGTLCDEAQIVMNEFKMQIYTNRPLNKNLSLENSWKSYKHTLVDLGEDEFTVGRLHPMIDFTLRNQRMLLEAKDEQTAIILFDLVIGWGANPDPLKDLLPVINQVKSVSDEIVMICSVTGTEEDPQNKNEIIKELEKNGVVVMPSNAMAAELAGKIVSKLNGGE